MPPEQSRQQLVGAFEKSLGYPTPEGPASLTSFEQLSYIDPRSVLVLKVWHIHFWESI